MDSKKQKDLKIFKIIGNEIRLKTLRLLSKNEKQSFNKIAKTLKIDRSKLAYHISILINSNLISNEKIFDKKEGKSFSFYSITNYGNDILKKYTT